MRYIVLTLLLFTLSNAIGQNELWTLERCIQYAFDNNISIKQSELAEEMMENNYLQSKLGLLPTVSADASQNFSFGNSVDPTTFEFVKLSTNSNSFGITASVPLFTGLQQLNNIKKTKVDKQAAQQDLISIKEQMSLTITTYFLNILLNREIYQSALKQIETTQEQFNNTKKLIDAGALPQGDLLDIEAQLAGDELRAIQGENNLELSKLSLQLILQLDPSDDFEIIAPSFDDPKPEVPSSYDPVFVYNTAIESRPEIKAEELRLKSTEFNEKLAKGAFYPTLSLSTSIRTNYFSESVEQTGSDSITFPSIPIGFLEDDVTQSVLSLPQTEFIPFFENKSFGSQLKDNRSESIGLNLSIPIFGGWQKMTNIENAKLATQISEFTLQERKNQLREEINQAYANAVAASKTFTSEKKSYEALQKSFEYAEEKYKLGTINSFDFLSVKNRLAISESNLLTAKYDYIFKIKILDFYAGNPITLN